MHVPTATVLFPNPSQPDCALVSEAEHSWGLGHRLDDATAALGLPARHPHGMRAYYVQVRRSMGHSDATIAEELGQGSGPALGRSTYGEPNQIIGSGRWDWLPATPMQPCWNLQNPARATNVVPMVANG